jgi:Bacterial surface protein, Ig-like domain
MKRTFSFILLVSIIALIINSSCETDKGEKPVLTLNIADSIPWILNIPYVEVGYTAIDEEDGDITGNVEEIIENLNIDLAGNYTIKYKIKDSDNNVVEKERLIMVDNQSRAWEGMYECVDEYSGTAYPLEMRNLIISDTLNNIIHFPKFGGFINAHIYGIINIGAGTINIPSQTMNCGIDDISRTFVSTSGTVSTNQIIVNYTLTETSGTINAIATYTR